MSKRLAAVAAFTRRTAERPEKFRPHALRRSDISSLFCSQIEHSILSIRPSIGGTRPLCVSRKFPQIIRPCDGGIYVTRNWRYRPGFRSRHHRRQDPFSRMARQQLGRAVFPPQGFYAGLHHRAWHDGEAQARIRQARRENHRPLGRPGRQPREVGGGHQGCGWFRAELPDDRRHRPESLEAVRDAAGQHRGHL